MQCPLTQPGDIGLLTQLLKGLRQAQPGLQSKFMASPKNSARLNWTKKRGGGGKRKRMAMDLKGSLPTSLESSSGGLGVRSGRICIYAPQQDGKCLQCIQLPTTLYRQLHHPQTKPAHSSHSVCPSHLLPVFGFQFWSFQTSESPTLCGLLCLASHLVPCSQLSHLVQPSTAGLVRCFLQ